MSPLRIAEKVKRLLSGYFEKSPEKLVFCRDKIAIWSNRFEEMEHVIEAKRSGSCLPAFPANTRDEPLEKIILHGDAVWNAVGNPPRHAMPGMISEEETRYYNYIADYYSGAGEAVELGPWLGRSTLYILDGLVRNPNFAGGKLHVVDDFIWRSAWMDPNLKGFDIPPEKIPPNHASFRSLFERYTVEAAGRMAVTEAKLVDYDGNEHLPRFTWAGDPVEMLFVDCGRTIEANKAWYATLKNSFIPHRTLIVMQDWQVFKEIPRRWYNQTNLFTAELGAELELIHELRSGGVATFLYRG